MFVTISVAELVKGGIRFQCRSEVIQNYVEVDIDVREDVLEFQSQGFEERLAINRC